MSLAQSFPHEIEVAVQIDNLIHARMLKIWLRESRIKLVLPSLSTITAFNP
jgi:hypothetical protein